jgi:hypothetical protein
MALKTLSKTNILNGNIVQAADVSQSVDAFTGIEGYAISVSGSFTFSGATTGSGFFQNAVNALSGSSVYIASNASTNTNYTLVFKNDTFGLDGFHPLAADGTNGPYYNPSTNVLGGANGNLTISGSVGNFNTITGSLSGSVNGTASFATSASQAITASYASVSQQSNTFLGNILASGSIATVPTPGLQIIAGASKTNGAGIANILLNELATKTLGVNAFITTAPTGSGVLAVSVLSQAGPNVIFQGDINTNFSFIVVYF